METAWRQTPAAHDVSRRQAAQITHPGVVHAATLATGLPHLSGPRAFSLPSLITQRHAVDRHDLETGASGAGVVPRRVFRYTVGQAWSPHAPGPQKGPCLKVWARQGVLRGRCPWLSARIGGWKPAGTDI